MPTIHIQNVGPLKDTGEIPIQRVTLILGPQGAGKSTLMKILCYCRWVEKVIIRDPDQLKWYKTYKHFYKSLREFYRLPKEFFSPQSSIIYRGDVITISWTGKGNQNAVITVGKASNKLQHNPKLAFVPAERNLVSAVQNIDRSYRSSSSDVLFNFIFELEEAKRGYTKENKLPLSIMPELFYYTNQEKENLIWYEAESRTIDAFYVASGIQSAFPLDVISSYLHDVIGTRLSLSASQILLRMMSLVSAGKKVPEDIETRLEKMERELQYSSMQLYIEEPEQNLFPEAQRNLMLRLLQTMSWVKEKEKEIWEHPYASSLVFTTHSPYLLSVLNTQLAVSRARKDLRESSEPLEAEKRLLKLDELQKQYNMAGRELDAEEYAAYFIQEDGTIKNLIDPEFPMVSGLELDGVSDWVEEYTDKIYQIAYGH